MQAAFLLAETRQREENKIQKTKIEWTDYTVNPVKGLCPMDCRDLEGKPYCYARRMYKRFKWDETIRYDSGAWHEPVDIDKLTVPSRIFVGSTMELFGPWAEPYVTRILEYPRLYKQHTFIFLTKRPRELARYNPWPGNCWVGCSVAHDDGSTPLHYMALTEARVKFVSFEPLLWQIPGEHLHRSFEAAGISWVIIGQQTPVRKPIPASWIAEIEQAADRAGIPVFEKDNVASVLAQCGKTSRREFPR